jgi:hypothetical protein
MASNAKKVVDHWAQGVFKKSHKGKLHRATKTPLGEKIPASKMKAALAGKYGTAARKEAQAAHNINE